MFSQFGSQRARKRARIVLAASVVGLGSLAGGVHGQTLYWDVNGSSEGATDGTTASGTWNTTGTANWTTDSTGNSPTVTFSSSASRPVIFSAGGDATGVSTVNLPGGPTIMTGGFTVEEGAIVLTGINMINNGQNAAMIMPGATLDAGSRFSSQSTGTLTIDGGTLRGTWRGGALITSNNATVDPTATASRIVGAIGLAPGVTSATLTKAGTGFFTAGGTGSFTTLNVDGGTYRVSTSDLGFGAANGTVNIADGASVIGGESGGLITSPATRQFIVSGNATFEVDNGSRWTINSPISGTGGITLNSGSTITPFLLAGENTYAGSTTINKGFVTISGGKAIPDGSAVVVGNNTFTQATLHVSSDETIASLASGGASPSLSTVQIGDTFGQVTSVDLKIGGDGSSTQFTGLITGNGSLTKVGAGTFTLNQSFGFSFGKLNVFAGKVVLGQSLTSTRLVVGDGTSQSAVLSTQTSSPYSLNVNGPNALMDLGASGSSSAYLGITLENGGTITGTGTSSINTGMAYDLRSGTIDVPLTGQGGFGAGGILTKTTAGTVTLNGLNTYFGGTNVAAGTLRAKRMQENNAVNLTGGTLQVMDSAPTLPAAPTGDDQFVSRPSSLAIANDGAALGSRVYSATLDLTNNDLILDYTDATPNPTANIEDMVRSGYAGGTWLGTGITSSTAASLLSEGKWVLAVADNATLAMPFGDGTTGPLFDGKSVDPTTTLVKFTYRVDLNLDGVMNETDMAIFQSQFALGTPAVFATGDLDFDGLHTTNDQALFNQYYAVVPEPTCLAVLAPLAMMMARRSGTKRRGD